MSEANQIVAPTTLLDSSLRNSRSESTDHYRHWRDSNVPKRHKDKSLLRHSATGPWGETYRRLKALLPGGPLIVLLGPRGVGKTQLGVCLLADICQAGNPVCYVKMMDFFIGLRSCYRSDGPDQVRMLDKLYRFGGLVLDEGNVRGDSIWEDNVLTHLVDKRYDAQRTTILIANSTPEAFAAAIGPSIVSRIHEIGELVVCDWSSYRTPK